MEFKERQIRALFDEETITVYQAYNQEIANAALENQRSGWAQKQGQERILAIRIKRTGFEWTLRNSSLSFLPVAERQSGAKCNVKPPVRVQWDPERDLKLERLEYRSIQIGLSGDAVEKYVNEWIVDIKDITAKVKEISQLVEKGSIEAASGLLPVEKPYPLSDELRKVVGATK